MATRTLQEWLELYAWAAEAGLEEERARLSRFETSPPSDLEAMHLEEIADAFSPEGQRRFLQIVGRRRFTSRAPQIERPTTLVAEDLRKEPGGFGGLSIAGIPLSLSAGVFLALIGFAAATRSSAMAPPIFLTGLIGAAATSALSLGLGLKRSGGAIAAAAALLSIPFVIGLFGLLVDVAGAVVILRLLNVSAARRPSAGPRA